MTTAYIVQTDTPAGPAFYTGRACAGWVSLAQHEAFEFRFAAEADRCAASFNARRALHGLLFEAVAA